MSARSLAKAAAKAAGETRYISSSPCSKGHGFERNVANGSCVECVRAKRREAYYRNPNQKIQAREDMRARRAVDPRGVRHKQVIAKMLHSFGLTAERYRQMFDAQRGLCFCGGELISRLDESRELRQGMRGTSKMITRVDHDHSCCPGSTSCGKCVRGLICSDCNLLLGKAKDDRKILLSAVRYLDVSRTVQAQPVAGRESASEIEPRNRDLDSNVCRGSRRDELSPFFN